MPGHKCPMDNPIPKLFRATMGQMGLVSDTKKRCASYELCPIRPLYRYKNTPTIGTYMSRPSHLSSIPCNYRYNGEVRMEWLDWQRPRR